MKQPPSKGQWPPAAPAFATIRDVIFRSLAVLVLLAAHSIAQSPSPQSSVSDLIDRHIFEKMKRDAIPHAPVSSDSEFLRRIYLDLTGRLADPTAAAKFL